MTEFFPGTSQPAPRLMTAEEAASYLRLDLKRDMKNALKALQRLVDSKRIRPCIVGKRRRYARSELDKFIDNGTDSYGDVA